MGCSNSSGDFDCAGRNKPVGCRHAEPEHAPLRPGQKLRVDGNPFVVEKIVVDDDDDVYLIQLARPGEHVARGPWIYSRAQVEASLVAEGAI